MSNKRLTLREAKRLSIIKWQTIVDNGGEYIHYFNNNELKKLTSSEKCGFCERNSYRGCSKCELSQLWSSGLGEDVTIDCNSRQSKYSKWHRCSIKSSKENYNESLSLELAKSILKDIQSIKEPWRFKKVFYKIVDKLKRKTTKVVNITKTVLITLALFISVWLFNHVNPWVGFILAIVVIYFSIKIVINKLKQKLK